MVDKRRLQWWKVIWVQTGETEAIRLRTVVGDLNPHGLNAPSRKGTPKNCSLSRSSNTATLTLSSSSRCTIALCRKAFLSGSGRYGTPIQRILETFIVGGHHSMREGRRNHPMARSIFKRERAQYGAFRSVHRPSVSKCTRRQLVLRACLKVRRAIGSGHSTNLKSLNWQKVVRDQHH